MTTTTLTRTNRYGANCIRCHGYIAPGDGLLTRTEDETGKVTWGADHPGDCPAKPQGYAAPVERVTTDGIYRTADGTIYKVQLAKQGSGRLYAKRLELSTCRDRYCGHPTLADENGEHQHAHFEYAAGAIHKLTAADKMTEHDARAFGQLYGICCACGADLTDETSIANGIGPVCGKRF